MTSTTGGGAGLSQVSGGFGRPPSLPSWIAPPPGTGHPIHFEDWNPYFEGVSANSRTAAMYSASESFGFSSCDFSRCSRAFS